MSFSVNRLCILAAATALVASCAQVSNVKDTVTEAATGGASDSVESVTLREQDKAFTPQFGPVEFADAFGSRETGPHGTFGKFPAGFETPAHIHSHGYRAVVLQGEMTNPFEGETNPPVMTAGSFWSVSAGENHTTACVSDTPCEFMMWGNEKFDFIADGNDSTVVSDIVGSVILPEEEKSFTPQFGPVEFADAFGSRETGPHGTFGKFPAGFETPSHTHSHGYRAIVLKGEMTNPFAGEESPAVMQPGSYWSVAAGDEHTTACVSDTPCEFLMWGDRNFDFIASE